MRFAHMGRDVWVGDWVACTAFGPDFPNVIHIWSDLNIRECRLCWCLRSSGGWGLPVRYSEGHRLATADKSIDQIARYASRDGPVLIHCAGGACRSPTLALLAMVARGGDPFASIDAIYRAMWRAWRMPPIYFDHPIAEILSWAETRQER